MIIPTLIGATVLGSFLTFDVIKRKKEKEKLIEMVNNETSIFINDIINDLIIFKKSSRTGIFATVYEAKRSNHYMRVNISSSQIEVKYYIRLEFSGEFRDVYKFIYDKQLNIVNETYIHPEIENGNILNGYKILFVKLNEKMIKYNFELPLSYFAKKSVDLINGVNPFNQNENNIKEEEKQINPLIKKLIKDVDELYFLIMPDIKEYLTFEEKHNIDTLYNKDFQTLKLNYDKINNKDDKVDGDMLDGLSNLKFKLKNIAEKIDNMKKEDLNKNKEVIKKRK